MEISAQAVKELREKTGIGMMKCKEALIECEGDLSKAIEFLRRKGLADAAKRATRTAQEGRIGIYNHHDGKLVAIVEVNCETDFAANSEAFMGLCKELSMQVASAAPLYVSRKDVPETVLEHEKEILRAQLADSGKPEAVVAKIVQGRLDKYFAEFCLLDQPYIKEPKMTVNDVVQGVVAKIGENVVVRRFARFKVGEER